MDAGNLVGDDVMIGIVRERLERDGRAARVRARRVSADGRRRRRRSTGWWTAAGRWSCSTSWCPRTCWCGAWRRAGSAASAASNAPVELDDGVRRSAAARWCTRDRRRRRDRAGAAEGLPAADQAAGGVLLGAADVPRRSTATSRRTSSTAAVDEAVAEAAGGRGERGGCDRLQVAGGDRADARGERSWWREVLAELAAMVAPGVTTAELDAAAERWCARRAPSRRSRATAGYPGDAVRVGERAGGARDPVERRALAAGDIVSLDMGVKLNGFYGDSAVTVPVGRGVATTCSRCCG